MGSPYVPLDTWVYPALDRLAALGYVQSGIAGLRPWTRMECARLVQEAAAALGEDNSSEASRIYRALAQEFLAEMSRLDGASNRGARLESVYTRVTGISGAPLTDGYHFGQTVINDYGRPYAEGTNNVTGASASAMAGPLAFYFRGEYQHGAAVPAYPDGVRAAIATMDDNPVQPAAASAAINRFRLLDTYVAFTVRNTQISVGKQSLWWGPGRGGPLLLSDNAEPMYMARITRTAPFTLPSIFSRLGPVRTEFFFAKMSGHRFPARPFMHGQKVSFKPTPNLEFGFSRTTVFAGAGHPLTFASFWRSFISVGGSYAPGSAQDVGDRRGGFDFTYRVPGLRNWLTLYSDSLVDDDPSPLASLHRAAMAPGIYMPQIPGLPKLDFRAEAVYTDVPADRSVGGKFIYWNGGYHDSHTNQDNLLGAWIGREARGLQLWSTYWFSPRNTLQVSYRTATVSKDFVPGGGKLKDIAARADVQLRPDLSLTGSFQYEHWEFPLLSTAAQRNATVSVQVTFWPGYKLP